MNEHNHRELSTKVTSNTQSNI